MAGSMLGRANLMGETVDHIEQELTDIFRTVFMDEEFVLEDSLTAEDVEGWDSVSHITLIYSIEECFGVTFSMDQLEEMSDVGSLKESLRSLLAGKGT